MICVLGAAGFIGSALVDRLREAGEAVMAPARDDPRIWTEELGDVIYCIGLTADFRHRPHETIDAHVSLLNDVLRRARFRSLLYLSSTRVYSSSSTESTDEEAVLRVRPGDPSDLYNLSKLTGECLCLTDSRPSVRVARLSNVVGRESTSENFVTAVVREARSGAVLLRTQLESAKDYIHIDDVTRLLPRIAREGSERLYNVASGKNTTHAEIVSVVAELTGCRVTVTDGSPTVIFSPVDIHRIESEFDFRPLHVLSVLPDLVREMREP